MLKLSLRREERYIELLGENVELVELSYAAQCEMLDAMRDGRDTDTPLIALRYGMPSVFGEMSNDEISANANITTITALADIVTDFSDLSEDDVEDEIKK